MNFGFASLSRHQGAAVCGYETVLHLPLADAAREVAGLMAALCTGVDARGGLVGHIKAFLSREGKTITLSTTGDAVTRVSGVGPAGPEEGTAVTFTAITLLAEDADLLTLVETGFHELEAL